MNNDNLRLINKGIQIESLSIAWMAVEFFVALVSGVLAHSLLLVALGLDSLIELISGAFLLWRLQTEKKQSDNEEKVARAERIASYVVGTALMLLAVFVIFSSIYRLITRQSAEASVLGIALVIGSCVLMPVLMIAKKRIGQAIGSDALIEDGMCNLVCAYMAFTVLIGAGFTALVNWWWADSVAALVLVFFIVSEGWEALHPDEE
ncbi:cation transporter [Sporolactobacillus shoreicorticis]|uniref:Cation diffusion facilitator family transporter n=1 Tax=Sporolactobacillus shoreicorticis TaxID=1923877 RepID=A0ABW5S1G0_9BACL|nr:cation transporter [Sporolactobacillus shoreicorticis]MCO7126506.1 cation transporter [Sporolactobacillus shoreicorticis]